MTRFAMLLLLAGTVSAADDPRLGGPRTYSTPSPDGQYLFVMIAPRPTDPHPKLVPEQEPREKDLYAKYSTTGSGLYRNDGSTTPLWTVDWYSYRVYAANDGIHIVRVHGDFPLSEKFPADKRLPEETVAEQVNAPGLSFYANGKLLKVYAVRELVRDPEALQHTLQHVLWCGPCVLTADGKQFGLVTQESRQLFFDLDTGNIAIDRQAGLGNAQLWAVRISLAVTGIAVAIIFAGFLYRLRKPIPSA